MLFSYIASSIACVVLIFSMNSSAGTLPAQPAENSAALAPDTLSQSVITLNTASLEDQNNLWQLIREGSTLPEVHSALVRKHEQWFLSESDYLIRVFDRSRPFLYLITQELRKRNMPMEIALLPIVESAYVSQATSKRGAAGLWQFMPATGLDYNLDQTWDYDARRDAFKATIAALSFLENLYAKFGDWSLALAAYNWGGGNVSRAIQKAKKMGKKPTYENLNMPNETRHYVPKLLAIRNILLTTPKYGLKLERLLNQPVLVALPLEKPMDFEVAAKLSQIPLDTLKNLNASYKLPVLLPDENRKIILEADHLSIFNENLKAWGDKPLSQWKVYIPERDIDVEVLAQSFDMKADKLLAINNIKDEKVFAGKPILVLNTSQKPIAETTGFINVSNSAAHANQSDIIEAAPSSSATRTDLLKPVQYIVKKGDTLSRIAKAYGVSIDDIKATNQLTSTRIQSGGILKIDCKGIAKNSDEKNIEYIVKKGDTLFAIARLFAVDIHDIEGFENKGKLFPGQKLIIMHR